MATIAELMAISPRDEFEVKELTDGRASLEDARNIE